MPTYYADTQNTINGPATGLAPATRVRTTKLGGRLRVLEASIISPAATLLVADKIVWGKLPLRAVLLGHLSRVIWTTGAASSTMNLGDNVNPARHMAATSITTAGAASPTASEQVNVGTLALTAGSNVAVVVASPGAYRTGNLVSGTGITAGTFVTATNGIGVGTLVTLSAPATATGNQTITATGDGYEVNDDSNSVSNAFNSTTDDATLMSVIAGAAAPANQVITLKAFYVQD